MTIPARDLEILEAKSKGMSNREIARTILGAETRESTVRGILNRYDIGDIGEVLEDHYAAMTRRNQKQADQLRIERKKVRESSRAHNVLEELSVELDNTFRVHKLSHLTNTHKTTDNSVVGVLQLSDLHFGERIDDGLCNVYDLGVITARLKKLVDKAKTYFMASGVETVVVAMTGDMINSDRRLDEVTSNAKNRTDIVFNAVDVIQQLILDLNQDFNVTVASVCGNESRVGFDVGWSGFTASDNYDKMIHEILSRLFEGSEGVRFIDMDDPLECVINVNGSNLVLIHGHNGIANQAKMEGEVTKLKARYISRGVKVDYVIMGHIHFANISDNFARSSGLVGSNAYSEKALNLHGKASQNIYLFESDGTIDGIKIDLQHYDQKNAYTYNEKAEAYKPVTRKSNVVIQSVLI